TAARATSVRTARTANAIRRIARRATTVPPRFSNTKRRAGPSLRPRAHAELLWRERRPPSTEQCFLFVDHRLERWARVDALYVRGQLRPARLVDAHIDVLQVDEVRADPDVADGQRAADQELAVV